MQRSQRKSPRVIQRSDIIDLIIIVHLSRAIWNLHHSLDVKCLTLHACFPLRTFLCLHCLHGKIDHDGNLIYWSLKLKKCGEFSTITLRLSNLTWKNLKIYWVSVFDNFYCKVYKSIKIKSNLIVAFNGKWCESGKSIKRLLDLNC